MNSARLLRGRCECGTVSYTVADEFLYAANCHCSRCRAATGSAFKPFAGIEREQLELVDDPALLIVGDNRLNDTRCAACGSTSHVGCGCTAAFSNAFEDGQKSLRMSIGSFFFCSRIRLTARSKRVFAGPVTGLPFTARSSS